MLRDAMSYVPPVQIGEVMMGLGLATVVKVGEGCGLLSGDVVSCSPGKWSYFVEKRCAYSRQAGRSMPF
jgi:NADPH-dependent curcumin reductase CurA